MIELCPPTGTLCITKQQIISTIPGPMGNIQIQSPDKVMEGGAIPVIVSATDIYGNKIGQSIQAYTIGVQSGDGKMYDGASSNLNIKFDNFLKAGFIYQAPTGIKADKQIAISITPDKTDKIL